jgi:diguanylate cyclase (GGDEF)-like protein
MKRDIVKAVTKSITSRPIIYSKLFWCIIYENSDNKHIWGNYCYMDKPKPTNPLLQAQATDRLAYLVSKDAHFASFVSQQITHFGYYIQHVRDIKSLVNIIADSHSIPILVDIPSQGDVLLENCTPARDVQNPENSIFNEISNLPLASHTLIFFSDHDNQIVRLKSIQAGGTAFFTKPINIVSLIDKLDSLHRTISNPQLSRVLIVEDQYTVASYYQMILRMSGMDAQIATKSSNVLEQVREFRPDLILMDTFMSEINPSDLARVIRQIDDFVSIPIIFLSGEDDFGKRIEALDLGGDDFLIKPIKASQLKAVVRSRLERSKILRSYMVRDSLTNLLNHTAFRSVLVQEVNRSKRQNTQLSLAMLDIDHFKQVNDTYGHTAGDSVLKGLSRLLQQRLRAYDIVGRYGGDEFVALLIDCDEKQSMKIMEEIRIHFSGIEFYPDETRPLFLTFSCGLSTFPQFQTAEDLIDAADQALYGSKASGRNRITTA